MGPPKRVLSVFWGEGRARERAEIPQIAEWSLSGLWPDAGIRAPVCNRNGCEAKFVFFMGSPRRDFSAFWGEEEPA